MMTLLDFVRMFLKVFGVIVIVCVLGKCTGIM